MKQEVLFIILNQYADWESAYLSSSIHTGVLEENPPKYVTKTVAPTLEPVTSMGGFRTLPDYSFDNIPNNYAALILVGGLQWDTPEAEKVAPIVEAAAKKGVVIGGICNGASFLAKHGFLNHVKHTGNGLDQLQLWGKDNYTNTEGYIELDATSDKNIATANGTGTLEFMKEVLLLLNADTAENIEMAYQFRKQGFVKFMQSFKK